LLADVVDIAGAVTLKLASGAALIAARRIENSSGRLTLDFSGARSARFAIALGSSAMPLKVTIMDAAGSREIDLPYLGHAVAALAAKHA